ncbi:MAG: hypothetical protein KDB53_03670, partial [Planctomycetes bacterium]|nr:hypothetical protein [Planctomycetota bacterium]
MIHPSAMAQDDELVDEWFDRAERFASRGQWTRAVTYFGKAYEARPDDELARWLRLAYDATGAWDQLESLIATHRAKDPESPSWFQAEIDLLMRRGRYDRAQAALEARLSAVGPDFVLEARLGDLHDRQGRDEQARACFAKMVARAKEVIVEDAPSLTALARAYLDYPGSGYQAAQKVLVDAQKADRNYLDAYLLLARVFRDLDLPTDSEREIKDALELRADWPALLIEQSLTAESRMGQAEQRRRESYAEVLRTDARHPEALFMRGMQHLGDAEWDVARRDFETALEVDPNHRQCLSGLAALYYLTHDEAGYRALVARVLAVDPTYGELYRIIAQALSERRRWPESLAMIDSAIEVDPADWRHQDDRARYALYLGKEGIGKEALAKANDLAPAGGVWRNNMNKVMTVLERDYETVTTPYFALKFHRDEVKVLSRVMAPFLDRSYEEFTKTYAFRPTTPLVFEVMKRHEEFSVRTMGTLGLGALGVCFGPTVFMDSPSAQRPGTYNWAGTAHHEIAHIFTLLASRGRVPRWLTEGLSSWEEVRRSESWGRDMESLLDDALHNDKLFGVREFDAGFRTSRIIFAYYQGEQVCRWIEETWGIEAIRKMLELFGQDHQIDFVLDKALGLTPEAFDAAFRAFVAKKLEPLKRVPNWDEDARRGFRL